MRTKCELEAATDGKRGCLRRGGFRSKTPLPHQVATHSEGRAALED